MADVGDRDRGGRRRRRRGGRKTSEDRDMPQQLVKPPIILAKPPTERNQNQSNGNIINYQVSPDDNCGVPNGLLMPHGGISSKTQVVTIKTRDDVKPTSTVSSAVQSIPSILAGEGTRAPIHHPGSGGGRVNSDGPGRAKLVLPPEMLQSVKLVDDSFQWCDTGIEMLQDQTDFLVVGVIGQQGVGKSTIMSLLAGNQPGDPYRTFAFRPENREARELGGHQTIGIDMFVTGERMVLLDSQPVLSASVLDYMIHNERKYPTEFTNAENCIEMQSLQIASFMLTVCNVVLVVLDWFIDLSVIRFLETAEMLKPATPSAPQDSGSNGDEIQEYYPDIVFVLNKAQREDFVLDNVNQMTNLLETMMDKSMLKFKGYVGAANKLLGNKGKGANLTILPTIDQNKEAQEEKDGGVLGLLRGYKGHPGFQSLLRTMRNQVLSVPRRMLTHTTLSEKNWFHYAARTWEAVKKSQLLSEYNRLLP